MIKPDGVLDDGHRKTVAVRHGVGHGASAYPNPIKATQPPEVIHTDQLRSYGVAIRKIPSLVNVDHQHVISTARCNNIIEQSHRPTRRQERSQQGFRRRKRAQEFLSLHARVTNLHHHSRTSVSASTRRQNQNHAFQTWSAVAAGVA